MQEPSTGDSANNTKMIERQEKPTNRTGLWFQIMGIVLFIGLIVMNLYYPDLIDPRWRPNIPFMLLSSLFFVGAYLDNSMRTFLLTLLVMVSLTFTLFISAFASIDIAPPLQLLQLVSWIITPITLMRSERPSKKLDKVMGILVGVVVLLNILAIGDISLQIFSYNEFLKYQQPVSY